MLTRHFGHLCFYKRLKGLFKLILLTCFWREEFPYLAPSFVDRYVTLLQTDHVERKVPKYENHKLRERKVKTLTRIWRDHKRTGTHKHTETVSRYFDWHSRLSQWKECVLLWLLQTGLICCNSKTVLYI